MELNTTNFVSRSSWMIRIALNIGLMLRNIERYTKIPFSRIPLLKITTQAVNKISHAIESHTVPNNSKTEETYNLSQFFNFPGKNYEVENIIVGSGPSAAIIAENLKGEDFLVIEKGVLPSTSSSITHSIEHVFRDFDSAGQQICFSSPPLIFSQGSVVGGGSQVNSGLYHSLPLDKLMHWSTFSDGISEKKFRASEELVSNLLHVQSPTTSIETSVIAKGARNLKYEYELVRRWRKYSSSSEFEHYGALETTWTKYTNRVALNCEVLKINSELRSNRTTIKVVDRKSNRTLTINCKKIYLCGGSISTANLLVKSNLVPRKQLKFNFHAMIRLVAEVPLGMQGEADVDSFQAWSSDKQLKFGGAVSTKSLLAFNLNRRIYNEEVKKLRSYYVSIVPQGQGGFIPLLGYPYYLFSKKDKHLFHRGYAELSNLILSGGGKSVITSEREALSNLSTVHVFGSSPIGSPFFIPGTTILKTNRNIQILDSSILPSAPSVNPQGPTMALVNLMFLHNETLQNLEEL